MPETTAALTPELAAQRERLLEVLRGLGRVVVAFSGGIDSTVVAQAAFLARGANAVAVTADSPSVPRAELDDARRLAEQIGIRHVVVATEEFADPDYVRNDGARCYFCKSELYGRIETLLPELGAAVVGQAGVAVPVEPAGPRRRGDARAHRPRRGGGGVPAAAGPARVPRP